MTDEGHDGCGAVNGRRAARRLLQMCRPRRSRLEQQPRHSRERLPGVAGRIDESPAIKVVALLHVGNRNASGALK